MNKNNTQDNNTQQRDNNDKLLAMKPQLRACAATVWDCHQQPEMQ